MTSSAAVHIRPLQNDERAVAAAVLSRGMLDNPINVAAFGPDARRRRAGIERMFGTLLHVMAGRRPLVALHDQAIIGVCGLTAPGACRPTGPQKLRFLAALATSGPTTCARVLRWTRAWSSQDPDAPHVHLGPVAVLPEWQGHGVGSKLLRAHVTAMDEAGQVGYLETDKDVNVTIYERFGYVVTGAQDVLGVPCWYMRRSPR